ncbi:MAG TPA: helix-turn-helix domain-containing protein [Pyrinomonadaceae bacterium]|nr:helix-turn-helix domain-containing protein [Pyrinomonadaceae bacterium]
MLAVNAASVKKGCPHMTLADERLKELDNPSLTLTGRVLLRCEVAADLIHAGQYEAAREALGELWRGVGERPNVEGLDERTAAEVLLQVGVLSSWLGETKDVREAAKDLMSESASLFESFGEFNRAAAARADLALCYWREGAYDEARVMLEEAAARIIGDVELKAKTVLRLVVVEASAGRYSDALRILTGAASLFEESTSHALKGGFHNELAIILRRLGTAERRREYFDRAIIEYTAAVYHFELARHERYVARIENNLAFLLYKLGRHPDAHKHLDRAQMIFTRLKDATSLAEVDETRARVLVAEHKYREANRILAGAIQTFEKGGESALLADAFTLQGVVWARLRVFESSVAILRRALGMAEGLGALTSAGQAVLTLIEEHGATKRLPSAEVYEAYQRADALLKDTQDPEDIERLRECARIVIRRLAGSRLRDKNFSFYSAIRELEAKLLEEALAEAKGSVTEAARLLGVPHQTVTTLLRTRHKRLASKRAPAKKRKRSIFKEK